MASVTTRPFWSWAAAGVMTWTCHRASARASAARTAAEIRHQDARVGSEAGQRGPEIFGNHVHQALLQGRLDQLAGAEVELELHRDPGVPDGQPVDRREQLALGEVERGDHHRVAVRAAAPGRRGLVRALLAGGQQHQPQRAGHPHGSPNGHDLTFSATPPCPRTAVRR